MWTGRNNEFKDLVLLVCLACRASPVDCVRQEKWFEKLIWV
jgi:hypothetical protein